MNIREMTTEQLTALAAEIKTEQARRAGTQRAPKQSVLPVPNAAANDMREQIEDAKTRAEATILVQYFIAGYRLTVPQVRALAKHWDVFTTSAMRKAVLIDTIVDVLVGGKLQSAAIARA